MEFVEQQRLNLQVRHFTGVQNQELVVALFQAACDEEDGHESEVPVLFDLSSSDRLGIFIGAIVSTCCLRIRCPGILPETSWRHVLQSIFLCVCVCLFTNGLPR